MMFYHNTFIKLNIMINLIKQIYDYELKGFNIGKKPSITNIIEELKFELHRLQYKKIKLYKRFSNL